MKLHFVESGSGPLVVLLHGFPEYWYSWRRQLPALASAGFCAVAPDLRGFNDSPKPHDISDYRLTYVIDDVAELIEQLGAPCALVGHDWGGLVAWYLAMSRPELVRKGFLDRVLQLFQARACGAGDVHDRFLFRQR